MKLMIASDIHGSAYYCRRLLEAFEREGVEQLLLLGDILYHGPRNALPRDYAPPAVAEMLNAMRDKITCVRGNCEAEVDQMVLSFPAMADYCLLEVNGLTLFATHGHLYNEEKLPPLPEGAVLLNGHTHVPKHNVHEHYTFINPGSVSIPKENSAHSCILLENQQFRFLSLDE